MLTHPTLEKLKTLRLSGMLDALEKQMESNQAKELTFEERLGMLLDAQENDRYRRRSS